MLILLVTIITACLITFIVMGLALILSNKNLLNREKGTPFECGFDSNSSTRVPFSLRFFLITIIFLIFDVEIVILLPCLKAFKQNLFNEWWLTMLLFLLILLGGLLHEWNQGALKWSI